MIVIHKAKGKVLGLLFLMQISLLSACSNTINSSTNSIRQDSTSSSPKVTIDKFEKFNRGIYKGNIALDRHIFKPVAKAYKAVTPEPIDTSISNFFENLGDIKNAANNLLQFKVGDALIDTERFIFNSTFGMAGLFDIATEMGLQKHDEDFGQTLAKWGVGSGPYIMLPLFGPSTLRDATAKFTLDSLMDPTRHSDEKYELFTLEKLDKRADLLSTEEAFKDLSDDKYIALRDAWLQRREYLIRDGKVDEKQQSDMIDVLEDLDDD